MQKIQCPECSKEGKFGKHFAVTEKDGVETGHCFRCGYTTGTPKVEALEMGGRVVPLDSKELSAFLSERGLEADTLYLAGVSGWEGETSGLVSLAFPRINTSGDIVKIKYRGVSDKVFFASPGGGRGVFYCPAESETLVITEGEIDALSVFQAGYAACSLPDGAMEKAAGNEEFFEFVRELLPKYSDVCIWTDADGPGRKAADVIVKELKFKSRKLVLAPESLFIKDANDALKIGGVELIRQLVTVAKVVYDIKEDQAFVFPSRITEQVRELANATERLGDSTGWPKVDELFRVRRKEMSIVTGWPGSGKSEWLDALTVNLAKKSQWRIAICSLENPTEEHVLKIAKKWDPDNYKSDLDRVVSEITRHFVFLKFEDCPPTIEEIIRRVELYNRMVPDHRKLDGLVIDPYNEIQQNKDKAENETDFISRFLGDIRRCARRENMHIWIVAHPQKPYERVAKNKDEEKEEVPDYAAYAPPTLSQISGSAHWHNKADVGITIQRKADSSYVHVHVRKVRQVLTGRPGTATLLYDSKLTTYS